MFKHHERHQHGSGRHFGRQRHGLRTKSPEAAANSGYACPCCDKHCSVDSPGCRRGAAFARQPQDRPEL